MLECSRIDSLVTPFVDEALPEGDQQALARHLDSCADCRAKVTAERSVRALIQSRRPELQADTAPADLKLRCAALRTQTPAVVHAFPASRATRTGSWASRLRPFALAASLVLLVGGAFLYQATRSSSRVLAAELAADHVKCFGLNGLLGTSHSHQDVEQSMASTFDWVMHLPLVPDDEQLELVGSRYCLYGEGRTAHIMYKHNGEPMSLFMLPRETRAEQMVQAFGHRLRMWSAGDRTFVVVSREPAVEIDRVVSLVRASLR
jgi:anti-sigma factor RsiW